MKEFLVMMLVLILLLAGCASEGTPEHTGSDTTAATEATAPGLYISDSTIEQQTQGAVRLYGLDNENYLWLSAIGDKLLLAAEGEQTELTLLTGAGCVPAATAVLDTNLAVGSWQATYSGFVYYLESENQAVYLDPQLQELERIQLPEEIQGRPVFSPDGGEIFYCVGQEIRALETERKLSRLIKSHACTRQTLLGCYFEGKVLACGVEYEDGEQGTIYVSAETGQTLSNDDAITGLYTYETNYLCLRTEGSVQQHIIGTLDGTAQHMNVEGGVLTGGLELGGVVHYSVSEDNTLSLGFFDLASGKKTAAISLPGVGMPEDILADRWTGCLWLLVNNPQGEGKALLRWDLKASAVEEETVYSGPLYTADAPNEAGLQSCEDRIEDIDSAHGIRVRIWQTAVNYPGSYTLEPEYQTAAINRCLDELVPVLEELPENFLYKSVNSRIRICIVRSVDGEVKAVQYWDNGDAFIVLSVGVDVRTEFMKALGYVVDSHVLGNSPMYDYWNDLNPEGFVYGDETTYSQEYLEGEAIAFFSEASMESGTEDRSQMFFQAMEPDNGEMFQSETMQKKLLLLCQAIRDAWRLERKTETYPWEQYLTQSIAYQE